MLTSQIPKGCNQKGCFIPIPNDVLAQKEDVTMNLKADSKSYTMSTP